MDSFFDVLIIFVIIISILNSIFGKKKRQQKKPESSGEPVAKDTKRDSVDLLEQIFGVPTQPKIPEYEPVESDSVDTWNPEEEFSETDVKPQLSPRADINYDKLESLGTASVKPNPVEPVNNVYSKIARQSKKQKEIIKKLKNPKTIRDYILVSEILNKPKALSD